MTVHICELPAMRDLTKTGIDDFLAHPEGGPGKALALIETAPRFTPPTAHDLMEESGIDGWTTKPDEEIAQNAFAYLREECKALNDVAVELLREELIAKLKILGYAAAPRVAKAALKSQNCSGNSSASTATLQHPTPTPLTPSEIEVLHDRCRELSMQLNILDHVAQVMHKFCIAGEDRLIKLCYLVITARLLDRPASLIIKGPSSVGKSYPVQLLIKLFPESAYYAVTGMSERALPYLTERLAHRTLIIYEAAGFDTKKGNDDPHSYFIRSLLSEGRVAYLTNEKGENGKIQSKLTVLEGPTGLITTTTAVNLHPENETRALSILANDSPEQTRAVMKAQVRAKELVQFPDTSRFVALQEWLIHVEHRVAIPFGERLADLIPPVAVRLRRDFPTVLTLIQANAVLHQATRQKDCTGRIVATFDDYETVRQLVSDAIGAQVDATVTATVRQTVEAVARLHKATHNPVSVRQLSRELELDKSTTSRRVKAALTDDYLQNEEKQRGRPYKLIPGDSLPAGTEILPTTEKLQTDTGPCAEDCNSYPSENEEDTGNRCSVASEADGTSAPVQTPSPEPHLPFADAVPQSEPAPHYMDHARQLFKAKKAALEEGTV